MKKIKLRALEPEDLDLLYTIENDMSLWDVGITNVPYSRYVLHDYIAQAKDDIYSDRQVRLIVENEDGEVVGMADVVNFDPQHRRAELGIVIQKDFRHAGYAFAAVQEVLQYSLHILHLHQVYVIINEQHVCTRKTETGALVQLVRMPACHAGGHEFESRTHRKSSLNHDSVSFLFN